MKDLKRSHEGNNDERQAAYAILQQRQSESEIDSHIGITQRLSAYLGS